MSIPSLQKVKDWLAISGVGAADSELLAAHIADTSDPHEVTKGQVGLGNVQNVAIGTWPGSANLVTVAEAAVTAHEGALSIGWGQVTGAPDVRVADYAAIGMEDNAIQTVIHFKDLYKQILNFTDESPASVSTPQAASNRILFGASRDYLVQFMVSAEVAGIAAEIEFELIRVGQATVAIQNISQATPGIVTAAGHPFVDGEEVKVSGVAGMTEANGHVFKVASAAPGSFALVDDEGANVATGGWGAYAGGGVLAPVSGIVEIHTLFPNGRVATAAASFVYAATAGDALELYAKNYDNANDPTVHNCTVLVHGL